MNQIRIAPVVEGDGEVQAFPVLLGRIVQAIDPAVHPVIAKPWREPCGKIRKAGGLERGVNALAKRSPGHSILVLIDSDDDCPRDLGPNLERRARASRPDL